jgi:hypothetical protein
MSDKHLPDWVCTGELCDLPQPECSAHSNNGKWFDAMNSSTGSDNSVMIIWESTFKAFRNKSHEFKANVYSAFQHRNNPLFT